MFRNKTFLTLSVPNFRWHLSYVFFYFNKLPLRKAIICKVERLNIKQRKSRWDGSTSRLIWIYAVCKSLWLSPVAVKELKPILTCQDFALNKSTFMCFFDRIYLLFLPVLSDDITCSIAWTDLITRNSRLYFSLQKPMLLVLIRSTSVRCI